MSAPEDHVARFERMFGIVRARLLLRGCELGARVSARGRVIVDGGGRIVLGDRVQFVRGPIATELFCEDGAELSIGAETVINYGASIRAVRGVSLGRRCLVASMVQVRDEARDGASPIAIGDDVWIAHGACIEPGVTIGAGSVISAGSVVLADVPPGSLAVGNPATHMPLGMMRGAGR